MKGPVKIGRPFRATERQNDLGKAWLDPLSKVVLADGGIRSGKTVAAARLLLETAVESPSTYLVARATYRELEDSTKAAFLRGDAFTPALIPKELIAEYRAGDNLVRLNSGSTILFRSLDEPAKLLGLSLGGALIDQAEELDGGTAGEHVIDTILGRLNAPGPRKLLLICNPGPLTHFVYRRYVGERTRERSCTRVHFRLVDNRVNLPDDFVESMLATQGSRPAFFKTFVEGSWGSFEGMAYTTFDDQVHVIDQVRVPKFWHRFESMDHGAASPTCWLGWAVDEDGNAVVHGQHYQAGWLVSEHAAEVLRRRVNGWQGQGSARCFADPSISASHGLQTRWGEPASVLTEYREHGVTGITAANNDRAAGYSRILELLNVDPGRPFPAWHPRFGERGSPSMFIAKGCRELVEQLQSAPVEEDGPSAGQAVDGKWESEHGHAHAALRYGAMSRPAPTRVEQQPDFLAPPDDPAANRARFRDDVEKRRDARLTERRYEWR